MKNLAYFGMGCFWGPDDYFSKLDGVLSTRVGYMGGQKEKPIYHDIGDHTETIEIEFDPKKVTYAELLGKFWRMHNPMIDYQQYRSVIFPADEEQDELARQSLEDYVDQHGEVMTAIEPAANTKFWEAEEYHQKYLDKNKGAFC